MVKKRFLDYSSHSTDVLCPYCEVGHVYEREYVMVYNHPGKVIRFAVCDNENCNVEWFASDTETIRRENTKNRGPSSGKNTRNENVNPKA